MNQDLLKILVCPETKQPLTEAAPDVIARVNAAIERGALVNRAHQRIVQKISGGLIREDGKYLYPIRDDIPIMLIEEGISFEAIRTAT